MILVLNSGDDTKRMYKEKTAQPLFWISLLRIVATMLIFVFHFLGLFCLNNKNLDLVGISIFSFISGFLIYPLDMPTGKWIKKKYLQTMIPYWLVITFVIIINYYIGYKHKSLIELLIIFFAGGMFVTKPLYVIAWYITFILSLYGMFVFCFSFKNNYVKFINFSISIAVYVFIIKHPSVYALSFIAGILLKKMSLQKSNIPLINHNSFSNTLFYIQNRCYSFFLIHGGVLLFFVKMVPLSPAKCFFISFFITSLITYFHYGISNYLIRVLTRRL